MRSGETRTVLVAGRGPVRTRVGVAIVWMGKPENRDLCVFEHGHDRLHINIYII